MGRRRTETRRWCCGVCGASTGVSATRGRFQTRCWPLKPAMKMASGAGSTLLMGSAITLETNVDFSYTATSAAQNTQRQDSTAAILLNQH